MQQKIKIIETKSINFLRKFSTDQNFAWDGSFSLYPDQESHDLYGMLDAAYILFITNKLTELTDENDRRMWAEKILKCQDENGYFSKSNARGHCKEHATAYAVSVLKILEMKDNAFVDKIKPMHFLKPLLTSEKVFHRWFMNMGMNSLSDIKNKNLGWHYIWRGSHVGGGIAAIIGMVSHLFETWWPETEISSDKWFEGYFAMLNKYCNPASGLWQRAFYNVIIKKPTIIDLGGASHFWWIYQKCNQTIPYPESVISSISNLQLDTGLYKGHPFCIDFDAINGLVTAYSALNKNAAVKYSKMASQAIDKSIESITNFLIENPFEEIYKDSHGLPGALAAIAECTRANKYGICRYTSDWNNPFDAVWWL